jgi:hypothetical protein
MIRCDVAGCRHHSRQQPPSSCPDLSVRVTILPSTVSSSIHEFQGKVKRRVTKAVSHAEIITLPKLWI